MKYCNVLYVKISRKLTYNYTTAINVHKSVCVYADTCNYCTYY